MNVTMDLVREVLAPDEPAYEAARSLGEDAVPYLIELMRGSDLELATKATSLLGMIGGQAAAQALRGAVADDRLTVRIAVAATAQNLEPELAEDLMLELLKSPEPVVRKVALDSVPATRSPRLTGAIDAVARGDDLSELRTLAAEVLAR